MKINEQIAILRKKKGVTQEEFAQVLGVTNQAVSKWESGQCCPDIQLLPEISKYFEVSIDELMCEKAPRNDRKTEVSAENDSNVNDPLLDKAIDLLGEHRLLSTSLLQRTMSIGYRQAKELLEKMQTGGYIIEVKPGFYRRIQSEQDFLTTCVKTVTASGKDEMLNVAMAMHSAWFLRMQKAESSIDSAVEAVIGGKWGYSAFSEPDITTVMRGQSVFYSKNKSLDFHSERIGRLCVLMKVFSEQKNLAVFSTLYELTVHDEKNHVGMEKIAEKGNIPPETVRECLEGALLPYIHEENGTYRIRGEAMAILPILSVLCY